MPEMVIRKDADPVLQFVVFVDNKAGRLHDLLATFAINNIHVMAISVLDSTENAIVRLVVDYPEAARTILQEHQLSYSESTLLAVELPDETHLHKVTRGLLEAEININYLYPFLNRPQGRSGLVLSVEDRELASTVLSATGMTILGQSDLAR